MKTLRLYHRTTIETAKDIYRERRMISEENTGEAYFSTVSGDHITGYGDGVVCIEVPEHLAEIDDEFPSGERHYRVNVDKVRPEHFRQIQV